MLGRSLLQGLRTESAAEAVKNRQRPKAKPLALASKAVRAAIRGPSPPRAVSKDSNSTKASTSALPDEEDEDDELRLKSKSTHTAKKSTRESSVTSRKSTGLVIEVDTDEEEDQPLNKPAKKAVGPKGPVSKSKGKGRQEVESESDSTSDFAGDDNEDLRAIGQIMAKESEEDSDYNGKGEAKDRWTKKSKKKKGQSKSSKSDPEEPVSRGANRLKKTKGQPSAVYPASKKDKSHTLKNYGVDSEDEEPVEVGTVRKTSRSSKKGTAKESKTRSPKGPQPRSKEFLDDEDMADDQVTTSWSQLHQSTTIVQPEKLAKSGPPSEASEGETEALASSSDAPVSKGRKVTKTYSRKTNNRTIAKVVDSDEDEVSDRARDIVENRRSSASTSCPPEEAKRKADDTTKPNDKTKINSKGRTKRSESPAYAVIIDNSAKKSKPPTSRDNGASTRTRAEAPPDPAPSTVAVSAIEQPLERDQQMTRPQGRKGLKPNIVESEEEVTESEEKQDSDSSAQPGQRASTKEEVNSTSNKPTEAGLSRLVLQSKDRNVTLPAQKMTTNDKGASTTPAPLSKTKSGSIDTKPVIGSTGKRRQAFGPASVLADSSRITGFHDMVVAKGGGQGIKPQGLSKRSVIPSLLTFRGVPPPKKKPIPPGEPRTYNRHDGTLELV